MAAVLLVLLVVLTRYATFGVRTSAPVLRSIFDGPARGRPHGLVNRSIGPVPQFVPLNIETLGIVLRGASFAFREAVVPLAEPSAPRSRVRRVVRRALLHGDIAGGIASGRVPAGQGRRPVASCINPTSTVAGILAATAVAYLAPSTSSGRHVATTKPSWRATSADAHRGDPVPDRSKR